MDGKYLRATVLAMGGAAALLISTLTGGSASAAKVNHLGTATAPLSRSANTDPRTVEFVHGINGNYRNFQCGNLTGGYAAILAQVCGARGAFTEQSFAYYQDQGYASASPPACPGMPPPDTATGALFVDPTAIDPHICDSKGALAYSAAALDTHLVSTSRPVTVIANSMGGAITRGWLALADQKKDASLTQADSVIFLQGAQSGSWAAAAGERAASIPVVGPIVRYVSSRLGFDVNRPGVVDVTPESRWYGSVNPSVPDPGVPAGLAYYNFYSNITVNFEINLGFFTLHTGSFNMGDTVMLPGSDNPRDEPRLGGARFLPGGQQTTSRHQFAMDSQVNINPGDVLVPPLLVRDAIRIINDPLSHFRFSSTVGSVDVTGCGAGSPSVTAAAEVFRILQDPTHGCAS